MNLFEKHTDYSLLSPLSISELKSYLDQNHMRIASYSKNQIIHLDGDTCNSVEILLAGKVVVERIDENGNLLTIAEFFPNDLIGGNLIFSKNPVYPMTITSKSETELLKIEKDLLFELCQSNRNFLSVFLRYISDNALLLGDKIKHYVNRSIRDSLRAYLGNASRVQNSLTITLTTSKKELADQIGVQRTSLSRELQKMKKEGLIDYNAKSITILDKDFFY